MESRVRGPCSIPARGLAEDRLQSWKEIAAYLGRDVRSLYRWEKIEHLPVYRLQHGQRGSVYAFKSELDAWVAARSAAPLLNHRRRGWLPWAAGASVLIVLALCASAVLIWRSSSPALAVPLPLCSSPGIEMQPSLSPDGRQVAFAWDGDDRRNFDIYVKLAAGGPTLQLTHDAADEYSPAWSPNGASVAFLRRKDAERMAVLIIPSLGGTERIVTEIASGARVDWSRPGPFLTWSRDGRWLVSAGWAGTKATDRLLRISVGTGETLALTTPPLHIYGDFAPALSPDGTTLAFSRRISWGASELCLLPVGRDLTPTGEVKRLDTGSIWNVSPTWSSDGGTLIFSTGAMDSPHLAKISASGREPATRLSGIGDYGWQPSLGRTQDGMMRLVYVQHFESVNLWRQPLYNAGTASELIKSAHRSYEPDYSPDGSRIAFLSDRSGYVEVWVANGDGTDPAQWTFLKQPSLGSPRWSPDGRRIAFTAPGPRGSVIYWINAPGAEPRAVPDSWPSGYLTWAPDGRSIYFSTNRGGATNIWRATLDGHAATQVTTGNSSRVPAVSRNERFLFFLKLVHHNGAHDLFRLPLPTGEEKKLLAFVDAYSPCRTGIAYKYYRPSPAPEGPDLRFYDFAADETTEIGRTVKPLRYGIAVSPDCRYLVYSQADYDVSDLMLVDSMK